MDLHFAATHELKNKTNIPLEHGTDASLKGDAGRTPLKYVNTGLTSRIS